DVGPDVAHAVAGDVFQGATPFPDWRPRLKPVARAWFDACEDLCIRLLRPVAAGLGAAPDALLGDFEGGHTSFLRLNHYPTRDPPWAEFRRRRADGDFADYGTEVQISDWRIA